MRPHRTNRLLTALLTALLLASCSQAPAGSPTTAATSEPPDAASAAPTTSPDEADATTDARVVEGDGFTITFPAPPTVETVEVPLEEGLSTEATIYQAQVDGVFVGFSHADTPAVDEGLEFDAEQALRDSAEGAAANTSGEVTEAELTTVLDRTAIDYLVTVPGGVLRGIAFFDGPRLYTGQLVAADGAEADRALLDELMASLTLT